MLAISKLMYFYGTLLLSHFFSLAKILLLYNVVQSLCGNTAFLLLVKCDLGKSVLHVTQSSDNLIEWLCMSISFVVIHCAMICNSSFIVDMNCDSSSYMF